jgi:transcriptional regulator with XRE-family HTH domain
MTEISLLLKETRESYGLTLEEVAQRTYIKLPYLQALEEGAVDRLPAPVYTYGYIRQYAKLLGLDGGALVAHVQQQERGGRPSAVTAQRSITSMADSHGDFSPFKKPFSNGNGQANGNGRAAYGAVPEATESGEARQAQMQAQQIIGAAEREAQQLVRGAERYADEVLAELEGEIAKALQTIKNGRQFLASRRGLSGPVGPAGL